MRTSIIKRKDQQLLGTLYNNTYTVRCRGIIFVLFANQLLLYRTGYYNIVMHTRYNNIMYLLLYAQTPRQIVVEAS